jgi:hypothetical protein
MDQSDSARSADSYYWRIAVLLPGFAALGLGVLYAAGAVIKTGQLQDAELVVRDTLPLVPLEQILALGIGAIASSTLAVGSLVFLAGFYLWATREQESSSILIPKKRPASRVKLTSRQKWVVRGFGLLVGALIVFTAAYWLWNYPIFGALSFLAATYFGSWAGIGLAKVDAAPLFFFLVVSSPSQSH